ncbi:MAG TPA: MFS transporter [Syntrophorhabdaceae bacterium]|nr:MFS transporter [Syntrophorhabdaceae bacterium]
MDKKIASWCLYDFANSSYSAVISATIFPVFYANVIVGNEENTGDIWWGRAIALSMAIVALASPFLGGIADYAKVKKRMMMFFTLMCVISVGLFSLLDKGMILTGFILMVIANIGMECSFVFYNAFLPEISHKDHLGRVSARGYGIGYLGSIVSLFLALLIIRQGYLKPVWLMVSLFFTVFSIPAFIFLPKDSLGDKGIFSSALKGLKNTIKHLRMMWSDLNTRKFLIAYLIYEDGVNTVIVFSSIFAATTLKFKPDELIYMYLLVQAVALLGAFAMARHIDIKGPKRIVCATLCLWIFVTICSFFVNSKGLFVVIASLAGLGLGTLQAATRAFFSLFIPRGEESRYFGVYNLVGKSSAVIGPVIFGYTSSLFKSQRPAILSVCLFFVAGLIVVSFVRINKKDPVFE